MNLLERCYEDYPLRFTALGYLSKYFAPMRIIDTYQIFYGIHNYSDKLDWLTSCNDFCGRENMLLINDLVRINTKAEQELSDSQAVGKDKLPYNVYEYDYIYTKLSENLGKQVK